MIKFYLKTKLKESIHLASTPWATSIICDEKEKFLDYLIKENQSTKEVINTLAGKFPCQNIGKQNLQHPDILIIKIQHLNIFSQLAKGKV